MGLERLTSRPAGREVKLRNGSASRTIVEFTAKLADRHYEAETQEGFAMRVIADHARATAFSIADGILPGNEGRNYVIAQDHAPRDLSGTSHARAGDLFFHKVTNFVVDQMHDSLSGTRKPPRFHREDGEAGRRAVWIDDDCWLAETRRAIVHSQARNAMPEYQASLAQSSMTRLERPRDLDSRRPEGRGFSPLTKRSLIRIV